MSERIAVIGGGLGGLSAAALLASEGFDVTLFEKNSNTGGKAAVIQGGGFSFDAGPSLLTMPFILHNLFTACGRNSDQYISLKKIEVICRYFYPDGTKIDAFADREKFKTEVHDKTGEPKDHLEKYLTYCQKIYDATADVFILNDFRSLKLFLSSTGLKSLLKLPQIDPLRTVHQANSSFFNDKRLVQLFDRYATYNGSSPFLAPATLNVIPHVEYTMGAYIPEGGIRRISEALQQLAEESGAVIRRGVQIDEIVTDGNKASGVRVDGKIYHFDRIISNADVNYTYEKLLNNPPRAEAKRYRKMEPSGSGLVFYWGVEKEFPGLEIHNILFSQDYENEFRELFEQKKIPSDPTVYVYISSKYHSSDAPRGGSNLFVMINTPYDNGKITEEEVQRTRETVISKVSTMTGEDIRPLIRFEDILTPRMIQEKTNSRWGSIYGVSSNSRNAAFLRQANRSSSYKNLYFCGGSAHPGGGIPLVIQSGIIAANKVIEDTKRGSSG